MRDIELAAPSRRNLLLGLGAGAIGAIGAAVAASPLSQMSWISGASSRGQSWWDRTFASLQHGGADEWSQLVGELFSVPGEGLPSVMRIAKVERLASPGTRPSDVARKEAFAVTFLSNPLRTPSGDRMYRLTHPGHSPLDLYLGIPAPAGTAMRTIAIFN